MLGETALTVLLVLAGLATGTRPPPPPVSEDTLEKVAGSLEMYVDRLPQMPKIHGYSMERGRATPVHLAVGMYRKKWVMKFVVEPAKTRDHSRVPARLLEYVKVAEEEAARKRYIVLYEYDDDGATGGPTHLYINGKRLEDPATETPRVGATEVWEVVNLTPDDHPLHLHLATFQAVRARGLVGLDELRRCMARHNDADWCNVSRHAAGDVVGVPEHERTWKNVGKMAPGYLTTVVVKFLMVETGEAYPFDATAEPGYVYHCHILDHEDNAMIRPLKLIR
ncbi:unnamed protein product [Triticum turgidum subsp. durum]|uniref:Plastocyanin-like domain-containing protein n=1 Tax=Triticum turgidum subsp. durum TaxID=4567 RepID=A0A9R0SVK6_TRITD|nr:unnamed protein product [Triticum turgidum subsp. durum]